MFVEESLAVFTNLGMFLNGSETRPDKKNKTVKNHNHNHTTFVSLPCPGFNCNVDKTVQFLELFCCVVEKMMSKDLKLTVLPFSGYQKFKY